MLNQVHKMSGAQERPMADSTDSTIMILQDSEVTAKVGMNADGLIDGLTKVFAKYEIPIGLMNKLMQLQEYHILDFMIDDSGSMLNETDSRMPNGALMTRWQEVSYTSLILLGDPPIKEHYRNPSIRANQYDTSKVSKSTRTNRLFSTRPESSRVYPDPVQPIGSGDKLISFWHYTSACLF